MGDFPGLLVPTALRLFGSPAEIYGLLSHGRYGIEVALSNCVDVNGVVLRFQHRFCQKVSETDLLKRFGRKKTAKA
jgi:hypothetical protein